nr:cysteine proteinase 3-like [Ipomoea batatas]
MPRYLGITFPSLSSSLWIVLELLITLAAMVGCHHKNLSVRVFESINITLGAEDELKYAVGLIRLVSVAFEVVDGFKLYESGVYTSNSYGSDPMDVNHDILAVGYGV